MRIEITELQLAEYVKTLDKNDRFKNINIRINTARKLLSEYRTTISDSNLVSLKNTMQRIDNLTTKRNPDSVCELVENELSNFEAIVRLEKLKSF